MYAVIKSGGKQYKVAKGDIVTVEKLNAAAGETVTLNEVLMLSDGDTLRIGTPLVEGGAVTAEILEHKRDDKILVFKKKRRQNYRRTKGHRQDLTVLKITEIGIGTKPRKAAAKAAPEAKKTEKAPKPAAKTEAVPAAEKTAATKKPAAKKSAAAAKPAASKAAAKKAPARKAAAKKETK